MQTYDSTEYRSFAHKSTREFNARVLPRYNPDQNQWNNKYATVEASREHDFHAHNVAVSCRYENPRRSLTYEARSLSNREAHLQFLLIGGLTCSPVLTTHPCCLR
jgi:hypothetical protein